MTSDAAPSGGARPPRTHRRPDRPSRLDGALRTIDELWERLDRAFPGTSLLAFDRGLRVRRLVGGHERFPDSGQLTSGRTRLDELFPPHVVDRVVPEYRAVLEGLERNFMVTDASVARWISARPMLGADGEVLGGVALSWDGSSSHAIEDRYRLLAENATDVVTCHDAGGRILYASPSVERLLGHRPGALLGHEPGDFVHADDAPAVRAAFARCLAGATDARVSFRLTDDGAPLRWLETTMRPLLGAPSPQVQCTSRDITLRRTAEEQLSRRVAQQAAVAELGDLALARMPLAELLPRSCQIIRDTLDVELVHTLEHLRDATMRVRAGCGWPDDHVGNELEVTSFGEGRVPGSRYADGVVVIDDLLTSSLRARPLRANGVRSGASVLIGPRQRPFGLLGAYSRTVREFTGNDLDFLASVAHVLASAHEQERSEARIRHDALHDPLTGLPNRALLLEHLRAAVARAGTTRQRLAVLLLDLDHFTLVNDASGHDVGDELLRRVASLLEAALRPTDILAHLGGDKFVILVEGLDGSRTAAGVGEEVQERLGRDAGPLSDGTTHHTSTSIGIAELDPRHPRQPEALLGDAGAATHRAKSRGRGGIERFERSLRSAAVQRVELAGDLRRALNGDEGRLWTAYQPYWRLPGPTLAGFEALARFDHPRRGPVPPATFIPIAEDDDLIGMLGERVLRDACREAAGWRTSPAGAQVAVTVNVSARQVGSGGLDALVGSALREADLAPGGLALEITEGLLLDETRTVTRTLSSIRARGVRLLLDDFGMGYASLGYLQRLELDGLKIDRSFVVALGEDGSGDAAILTAIVALARSRGMVVVAEGIETAGQLERMAGLGCDLAQGFLLGRPLDAAAAAALVRSSPVPGHAG